MELWEWNSERINKYFADVVPSLAKTFVIDLYQLKVIWKEQTQKKLPTQSLLKDVFFIWKQAKVLELMK